MARPRLSFFPILQIDPDIAPFIPM